MDQVVGVHLVLPSRQRLRPSRLFYLLPRPFALSQLAPELSSRRLYKKRRINENAVNKRATTTASRHSNKRIKVPIVLSHRKMILMADTTRRMPFVGDQTD